MLDGSQNGNDGKTEEEKPPVEQGDQPKENLNHAFVKDGVMTVLLYLEEGKASFACAIGSLELAKDMVKGYFSKKMMAEAAAKARATNQIIRPTLQ